MDPRALAAQHCRSMRSMAPRRLLQLLLALPVISGAVNIGGPALACRPCATKGLHMTLLKDEWSCASYPLTLGELLELTGISLPRSSWKGCLSPCRIHVEDGCHSCWVTEAGPQPTLR